MITKLRIFIIVVTLLTITLSGFAQKKILFDNTKNETAGNADWIIDDDQAIPVPEQSGITQSSSESYWQGALSSWGVEMVKRGYYVETLPDDGFITYNNTSNSQDLSNYDIFVICEPNNPFSDSEKLAIINFVQAGGGLFIISDHAGADRDGDGWDALEVWNDFFASYNNPFGFTLDVGSNINKDPALNVSNLPSNLILHGPAGDVDGLAFYNGATFTIDTNANSTAVGLVFYDGYSTTGTTGVMAVCATYGHGRVVGVGDSSVPEDETAHDASVTYPGWSQPLNAGDASGDDGVFITNATIWLSEAGSDKELLINPDFTLGLDGWWAYGADVSANNGEATFNITDPGVNPWDIQLGQGNLTLQQNYTYELCWRATRESGQIEFSVGLGLEPYTQYFNDVATGFTGEWQEHCISYTHANDDVSNIALTVNLGGNDANATFDYIRLTEKSNQTVNVTFSVNMHNETVSNNEVYMMGSFNNWTTPVLMQPYGDVYSSTIEMETNKTVEFKYVNGSTEEIIEGTCANSNGNRRFIVPDIDISFNTVCFGSCTNCTDPIISSTNPGPGPVSYYGEMQVDGNTIVGERTRVPVQVKGMSFFWSLWGGEEFWTEGAVNSLVDYLNVELVRAPMTVDEEFNGLGGYLHDQWKETQIAFVEKIVDAAIARDIYVIIDYHSHHADEHIENATEFFAYMAQIYGQYDNIIFEIYNEPIVPDWPTIKAYAETVVDTIRKYSDNLVLIGTEDYSRKVNNASLLPVDDDNTAYVFHFYASYDGNTRYQNDVIAAINNGIAVFTSEWGNIYAWGENEGLTNDSSFQQSDEWQVLLDNYSISSANWCVLSTNMSSGNPNEAAIFNHESGSISRIGEYWNDTSLLTPSGLYMHDLLNEQAEVAKWRQAEYINTVNTTFTVDMQDVNVSEDGVYLHIKNYNNESDIEMIPNGLKYSATLPLPVNSFIKYRFVNGTEAENSSNSDCIAWDNYRFVIVPDSDYQTDTVCFNTCNHCGGNSAVNNANSNQFKVFPNPSNRYIIITGLPENENLKITVLSINGVVRLQYMTNKRSTLTINLSNLIDGLYFIKIIGNGKNEVFKIIHKNTK